MNSKLKKALKKMTITLLTIVAVLAVAVFLFFKLESFGQEPSGERLERIKKSPNYKDGSFQNLTDTPVSSEGATFFKMAALFFFGKDKNAEPSASLPSVITNLKVPAPEKPTFTYFGHSSYLIQAEGRNILMDPVFSERTSPVQFAGTKSFPGTSIYGLQDMPHIDFVFLSHDHYDHMDYETLKALAGTSTRFVVPLGVGAHLEHWGIAPDHITELDWWDKTEVAKGITLTATPARHFSGRNFRRGKSLWASYVLELPDYKVFLGGDSGYEKHFSDIGEKFGPFDLVILECGQYNEMWPYIHMMPEQTVQAAIDLGAKVLWPVHWGKFALALHAWNEPPIRVSKRAQELRVKLTTPRIGEQVILNKSFPNQNWWELQLE